MQCNSHSRYCTFYIVVAATHLNDKPQQCNGLTYLYDYNVIILGGLKIGIAFHRRIVHFMTNLIESEEFLFLLPTFNFSFSQFTIKATNIYGYL